MTRTYRWARRAVWGTLAVVLTIGCNPLTTIAFLTHKDVKIPAEAPLAYKKDDEKHKDKEKEIQVAVFVSQGTGQSFEFAGVDGSLAQEIAKKLPEMAKENKQNIVVIPPAQVNRFKMQNQNWKYMHAAERGRHLGADFVLLVNLDKMSLFKPGTRNEFYEGRADVTVDTYQVDEGQGEPKYTYVHAFVYPKGGFSAADSKPVSAFRREFIENLAVELVRHHVDHKPSSGIAEGR
jgi:hypothetical protein